jgi:hypothetical protein
MREEGGMGGMEEEERRRTEYDVAYGGKIKD